MGHGDTITSLVHHGDVGVVLSFFGVSEADHVSLFAILDAFGAFRGVMSANKVFNGYIVEGRIAHHVVLVNGGIFHGLGHNCDVISAIMGHGA